MAQIWAGTDIGKTHHHCVVLDTEGRRLLSRRVRSRASVTCGPRVVTCSWSPPWTSTGGTGLREWASRFDDAGPETRNSNCASPMCAGCGGDETNHVAWRKFREHGRTLLVANANRTPAEQALGCDIISCNVTRHSLVLVQYKKLDAERGGFY